MITRVDPLADKPDDRHTRLGMTATIKTTAQESKGAFGLVELILSAHFRNMAAHWHRETMETLYVLAGTVAFTVGDVTFTASSGRVVIIPPGTVHHVWNPTMSSATLLQLYTPGGSEAYFTELAVACTAMQIETNQLLVIAAKYDQFMPSLLA